MSTFYSRWTVDYPNRERKGWEERETKGWIKWEEQRERSCHGHWDVHRAIRKKRWVFVHAWVCLSGKEREEEERNCMCAPTHIWVCLHASWSVNALYSQVCMHLWWMDRCVHSVMFADSRAFTEKTHRKLQNFTRLLTTGKWNCVYLEALCTEVSNSGSSLRYGL